MSHRCLKRGVSQQTPHKSLIFRGQSIALRLNFVNQTMGDFCLQFRKHLALLEESDAQPNEQTGHAARLAVTGSVRSYRSPPD